MNRDLFFILLLILVVINLIPGIILSSRNGAPGKRADQAATNKLRWLAVFGGGAGTLLAFLFFPKQRTKSRRRTAVTGTIVWALIVLLAAYLLLIRHVIPEDPNETTRSAVNTSTEVPFSSEDPGQKDPSGSEAEPSSQPVSGPQYIKLVAVGDMLMHTSVSDLALQPDGSYDYSFIFDAIRDDVRDADIAVVNNEIPFGGDEYGLRGYPRFNVLTQLGDAEAAAGFNVILCATNHVLDMDVAGLDNTMNFWKKYPDVHVLGVHPTQQDQDSLKIMELNGVKIAMFNMTFLINGYRLPADRPYMVDMMTQSRMARIRRMLEWAEKEADFTIVFPHWGVEYQQKENEDQLYWAKFFTDCGADLVIGTHPHVIQPVKTVTLTNGKSSLCYYSLGNYISAQEVTPCLVGSMAKVTLVADENGVRIADHDIQYLVTHYDSGFKNVRVVKYDDYTEDLVRQHGLVVDGRWNTGTTNSRYPFSKETLQRLIDQAEGRIDNAAVEPAAPVVPEASSAAP